MGSSGPDDDSAGIVVDVGVAPLLLVSSPDEDPPLSPELPALSLEPSPVSSSDDVDADDATVTEVGVPLAKGFSSFVTVHAATSTHALACPSRRRSIRRPPTRSYRVGTVAAYGSVTFASFIIFMYGSAQSSIVF